MPDTKALRALGVNVLGVAVLVRLDVLFETYVNVHFAVCVGCLGCLG